MNWETASKLGVVAVAGFWGGLSMLVQLMFLLMILDIVSGFAAGFRNKELSSDKSYVGMRKKVLILILVGATAIFDQYTSGLIPFSLLDASAGFFAANEAISIVENASRGGVQVPAFIRDALAKLSGQSAGDVLPPRG